MRRFEDESAPVSDETAQAIVRALEDIIQERGGRQGVPIGGTVADEIERHGRALVELAQRLKRANGVASPLPVAPASPLPKRS